MALDAAVCLGDAVRPDPLPPRALSHIRSEKSNEVDDPNARENASCEANGQPRGQKEPRVGVGATGCPGCTPCMSLVGHR